eukprot:6193559-Pleurochrysis_carterae.AAC.2
MSESRLLISETIELPRCTICSRLLYCSRFDTYLEATSRICSRPDSFPSCGKVKLPDPGYRSQQVNHGIRMYGRSAGAGDRSFRATLSSPKGSRTASVGVWLPEATEYHSPSLPVPTSPVSIEGRAVDVHVILGRGVFAGRAIAAAVEGGKARPSPPTLRHRSRANCEAASSTFTV